MHQCSVGIAFGHWPGTVHVTSVKEKKKHPSSSLSSLVLHVSSVSLSVCFVSAHAVLLTYSRCCQSTSNLKRKNLDHHSLVYHRYIYISISIYLSIYIYIYIYIYTHLCAIVPVLYFLKPVLSTELNTMFASENCNTNVTDQISCQMS